MEEVKDHLGHSSIRVTSDRYGHLSPEVSTAVADAIGGALAAAAAELATERALNHGTHGVRTRG